MEYRDGGTSMFEQPETQKLYPTYISTTYFINSVYKNILNRQSDSDGVAYWKKELDGGNISREKFIIAILNGAKDNPKSGNDVKVLTNKTTVGRYFALEKNLNDVELAKKIMSTITSDENSIKKAQDMVDYSQDTADYGFNTPTIISGGSGEPTPTPTPTISTPTIESLALSLEENSSVDAIIGSIPITSNGGATITGITLSGTGNEKFSVSPSGVIKLVGSLDYETATTYALNAIATNSAGNSNDVNLTINITNIIDNAPRLAIPNETNITETASIGTKVLTVRTDGNNSDQNITSSFEIISGNTNNDFNITSQGDIIVAKPLNYTTTNKYTLGIQATNVAGNSAIISAIFNIINVAANPLILTDTNLILNVEENATISTKIGSVTIKDSGDYPISDMNLSGVGSGDFNISLDGNITVAKLLDYEAQHIYHLTANATNDSGNSNDVNLTINVIDITESHQLSNTYNGGKFEVFFINQLSNDFNYTLKLGDSIKDVYLLFTNADYNKRATAPKVTKSVVSLNLAQMYAQSPTLNTTTSSSNKFINIIPAEIRDFNENPPIPQENASTDLNMETVGLAAEGNTTVFKDGDNNDIYDHVHNIVGEEWESTNFSDLIADNNEITILFFDIANDNQNRGGMVGYFHAINNYKKSSISNSNERIMFFMDSVMFASEDNGTTWDINDFWPNTSVSTLAHEFQHMIYGRLPVFNANNYRSLTTWNDLAPDYLSYSVVYSFGAFLTRNYGGANLITEIVNNNHTDYNAIVEAVNKLNNTNKTFSDLLREWGISVLLSDNSEHDSQNKYEINTNSYFSSYVNGLEYRLGSINVYNYGSPTIYKETSNLDGDIGKYETSNLYYEVGTKLTGDVNLTLNTDDNVSVTVIVK